MALVMYHDAAPEAVTAASGAVVTRTLTLLGSSSMGGVSVTSDGLGVQITEAGAYMWGFGVTATLAGAGSLTLRNGDTTNSNRWVYGSGGSHDAAMQGSFLNLDGRVIRIFPSVTPTDTSITSVTAFVVSVFRIASFDID